MAEEIKTEKVVLDEASLEKFDPTFLELRKMVEKTQMIKSIDLADPEQLAVVIRGRIELKKTRVQIEKYGKALREGAQTYAKKVIAKEKELIGIIEPEEQRLAQIEEDAEKEELRKERLTKLPDRKARLAALNDGVTVSDDDLLILDATGFEEYYNRRCADQLDAKRREFEAKQKEIEEEKRKENQMKEEEIKAREAKAREKEEANAREEARLRAEKDAQEREIKARKEAEEEAKRREHDREEKELQERKKPEERAEEDKKKRERADKYRAFREGLGWTEKTKSDWYEKVEPNKVILFKKAGEFDLGEIK